MKMILEEQLRIKLYAIKHLILQKIWKLTNTNMELLQWFIDFFIKGLLIQAKEHKLVSENKRSLDLAGRQLAKDLHKPIK